MSKLLVSLMAGLFAVSAFAADPASAVAQPRPEVIAPTAAPAALAALKATPAPAAKAKAGKKAKKKHPRKTKKVKQ